MGEQAVSIAVDARMTLEGGLNQPAGQTPLSVRASLVLWLVNAQQRSGGPGPRGLDHAGWGTLRFNFRGEDRLYGKKHDGGRGKPG